MAGRKPIDDDRKRKAVTMNVSNKDLKILDNLFIIQPMQNIDSRLNRFYFVGYIHLLFINFKFI